MGTTIDNICYDILISERGSIEGVSQILANYF